MKPIIGIIARPDVGSDQVNLMATFDEYRKAIIKFNGIPILILPPQFIDYISKKIPKLTNIEKNMIKKSIDMCDGILLPGGNRIYEYDLYIYNYVTKKNKPVLGICMGMQSMTYNINHRLLKVENHHIQNVHRINLVEGTKLYRIYKEKSKLVNSLHNYQVIDVKDYKISALSDDGVIEAIEGKGLFNIGVQWHPEKMLNENKKLFVEFIKQCKISKST